MNQTYLLGDSGRALSSACDRCCCDQDLNTGIRRHVFSKPVPGCYCGCDTAAAVADPASHSTGRVSNSTWLLT
ncbi:hypothetical protein L798_07404 [Zootermopsis nevadensis]|uniref:Uncharacterized protein n=1 Tax=Zootermopsis nevadensis TaxID=136037 RepID=A0A067QF09_ZOONE|nr:hypothetical protein L798_07404 [Zootermopsis nevadensis]